MPDTFLKEWNNKVDQQNFFQIRGFSLFKDPASQCLEQIPNSCQELMNQYVSVAEQVKTKRNTTVPAGSPLIWLMSVIRITVSQSPAAWLLLKKFTLDMKASQKEL